MSPGRMGSYDIVKFGPQHVTDKLCGVHQKYWSNKGCPYAGLGCEEHLVLLPGVVSQWEVCFGRGI